MAEIKIFAMNDCDWMAAETLEQAIQEYKANFSGDGFGAFDEKDSPRELTSEEMDRLMFRETGSDDEPLDKKSFRTKLEEMIADGEKFPAFFASTEF